MITVGNSVEGNSDFLEENYEGTNSKTFQQTELLLPNFEVNDIGEELESMLEVFRFDSKRTNETFLCHNDNQQKDRIWTQSYKNNNSPKEYEKKLIFKQTQTLNQMETIQEEPEELLSTNIQENLEFSESIIPSQEPPKLYKSIMKLPQRTSSLSGISIPQAREVRPTKSVSWKKDEIINYPPEVTSEDSWDIGSEKSEEEVAGCYSSEETTEDEEEVAGCYSSEETTEDEEEVSENDNINEEGDLFTNADAYECIQDTSGTDLELCQSDCNVQSLPEEPYEIEKMPKDQNSNYHFFEEKSNDSYFPTPDSCNNSINIAGQQLNHEKFLNTGDDSHEAEPSSSNTLVSGASNNLDLCGIQSSYVEEALVQEDKTETSSIISTSSTLQSTLKPPSKFRLLTQNFKKKMKKTFSSASVYNMGHRNEFPHSSQSHNKLYQYNDMMDKMRHESSGISAWAQKQVVLGPPRSLTGLPTTKVQRVSDRYPEQFQKLCDILSDVDKFILADYLLTACGDETLAISNYLQDHPKNMGSTSRVCDNHFNASIYGTIRGRFPSSFLHHDGNAKRVFSHSLPSKPPLNLFVPPQSEFST